MGKKTSASLKSKSLQIKCRKGLHTSATKKKRKQVRKKSKAKTIKNCVGGGDCNKTLSRVESSLDADVELVGDSDGEIVVFETTSAEWRQFFCRCFEFELIFMHNHKTGIKSPYPAGRPKRIQRMGADGNCFFRCLSKVISGSEKYHQHLRGHIVNFQEMYKKRFRKMFDVPQHLRESNMQIDGVWATECEIFAAAAMLQTTINVYTQCGYSGRVWVPYHPCFKLKTLSKLNGQIYLSNYFNVHFNVVIDTWSSET